MVNWVLLLLVPDLVVMIITPLAPLDPYKEVEEASFKTEIDSTCSWAILFRFPLKGAPSTITRGEESALIEPTPLILMMGLVPGTPPEVIILTPGMLP